MCPRPLLTGAAWLDGVDDAPSPRGSVGLVRIAVTGAFGFIGRSLVQAALAAGHSVLVIGRGSAPKEWSDLSNLECRSRDLVYADDLAELFQGCDAVVHLAAVMRERPGQLEECCRATQRVLEAMDRASIPVLIGMSSVAVYDGVRCHRSSVIDESSPINEREGELGRYARMKSRQERLYHDWWQPGKSLVVLRPGMAYDDLTLSDSALGYLFLAGVHGGSIPVVHVASVSEAILSALTQLEGRHIFNLFNDSLPNYDAYLRELRERGFTRFMISVPWWLYVPLLSMLARPLKLLRPIPDGLHLNSLHLRHKPFRFDNSKAKRELSWRPRRGLESRSY
jgi:nucleoside-diphosphate-sugar epimerase